MNTSALKKFAQGARRDLIEQVSTKLQLVLSSGSTARREASNAVDSLEKQIQKHGEEQVIDRIAYIWFNRFCALRFMDVNRYTRIGVVSPIEGQSQPEILAEAKSGYIDDSMVSSEVKNKVLSLINGSSPSTDPQSEAYRLLVVAVCNYYHQSMPYLFERITDYTELLMPDDLLSDGSVIFAAREVMTAESCQDVEIIGWLYQFYISEKKDEVFAGLKKNKKVTPENIPAATQLFTPHWIVRYLVENSLGRLWLLNNPNSKLADQMKYYIKPDQVEEDYLQINSPEELKICDPACGSGHMLTYAFDLLYDIYAEEGYEHSQIPEKILTNNLFGIEIDERAGELAAFALTMKARAKQKRFFRKQIQPNICILQNVHIGEDELKEYMEFIGQDLFTDPLRMTLTQFEEVNNFGSLIQPRVKDAQEMLSILNEKDLSGQLFLASTHKKVLQVLKQTDYLSQKYQVVAANPPYMGGKGMNEKIKDYLKENYPDSKSDLFSAFIERNLAMTLPKGQLGFMTPFVWMFISSYEKLRDFLINQKTITSLVQLEYSGFDGATVPICTFTIENAHHPKFKGGYVRLSDFRGSENQAPRTLEAINNPDCSWFYRASAADFKKIPGCSISYWVKGVNLFEGKKINDLFVSGGRNKTHNNEKYLRYFWEIRSQDKNWVSYANGGDFRKYAGNELQLIDWSDEARDFYSSHGGLCNPKFWNKEGITWSLITSAINSFRIKPSYSQYSSGSPVIFNDNFFCDKKALAFLNSPISNYYLKAINPTLNTTVNDVFALPFPDQSISSVVINNTDGCIDVSRVDWNAYETSWDFTTLPLLTPSYQQPTLKNTYQNLRTYWQQQTQEMQRLEEESNRIFIEAYGLQDELVPEVSLKEITLTCNPRYRYRGDKSENELEELLQADTMRELLSYAVGCMFGRYALDKPGLILANQGETIEEYLKQIPDSTFMADDDNVIPLLDGNWFGDDIVERFYGFVRTTFGDEHYQQNIRFIEESIGKGIRKYFLKDFYTDHIKRYKKRPIYWMFSSAKGSFNVLIYMHRYQTDTASIILNDYLREFRTKLESQKSQLESVSISTGSSAGEKTKALKEIDTIGKTLRELDEYEHEVLYPLATEQVEIDLDDGVKVNYNKFGTALKKVAGLSGK